MTTKELVIKLLQKLEWRRKFASGLLKNMQKTEVDEKVISGILNLLLEAKNYAVSEQEKILLEKSHRYIEQIHSKEILDKKDINLENMLLDI